MALQHAYSVTNKFVALGESAISFTAGSSTNKGRLIDGYVDKQWDAGSVSSGLNIVFDAGGNIALSAIAILNHNCNGAGVTVTVQHALDSGFSVNLTTVKSATTLSGKDSVLQFTSASKQYWRLVFAWSGSFQLKVGELFGASTTALTRATVFGNARPRRIEATHNRTDGGRQFGNFIGGPISGRRLTWEELSQTERDEIFALFDAVQGTGRDVLWCDQYETVSTAATAATQECLFGRCQDAEMAPVETDYGLWSGAEMHLVEQGRGVGA